jgi:glutamyl-tRNA synthetase
MVFESLGCAPPMFAHLAMIWGADGKKLSKRHGATSVEAFHDEGFLPEALLNYLALLGWSLDGETTIISADVLRQHFSLDRISKNPAIFDFDKLEWMNGVYIRDMEPDTLVTRMLPWLEEAGLATAADLAAWPDWFRALVPLVGERLKRMTEIAPMVRFLFVDDLVMEAAAVERILAKEGAGSALAAMHAALASLEGWNVEAIEATLRTVPEALGVKPKTVFQVARVAITGSTVSPPLFESLALLGRDRTLARLEAAKDVTAA